MAGFAAGRRGATRRAGRARMWTWLKPLIRSPARASLAAYLSLIVLGAVLLKLPPCTPKDRPLGWADSFFTATSAVCVTGLVVRSTEHDFTVPGQIVLGILIQIGGIGIMTITTFIMVTVVGYPSLWQRRLMSETAGAEMRGDFYRILRNVLVFTVLCELTGFAILGVYHAGEWGWQRSFGQALFHAVSAFCNAGFALHDTSLMAFEGDVVVNGVIIGLIVVGGLGFPVWQDLWETARAGHPWRDVWGHLRLHTKLMLIGTGVLIATGTAVTLAVEWHHTLAGRPLFQRLLPALFHSVTCRTAGFNTLDLGQMTTTMLFFSMVLMAIGAGPCSTGGGFKVSTIAILFLRMRDTMRGHTEVFAFGRWIPRETVNRAMTTAMIFAFLAVVSLGTLLLVEQFAGSDLASSGSFLDVAFEVVSALGTVGLSRGITPQLTLGGKWVIIFLMLMGRLGPISVLSALSRDVSDPPVKYPVESPLIG